MTKRALHPAPPHPKHEIVDPRWLLKAGAASLLVALLCAYATLCFLFYQGQWQFALHPSRTVAQTPASLGLQFESVRFGVDATGIPQLDGWWIPAATTNARTALVLHGADGSIADALREVAVLHDVPLNVLIFDYRGFGASGGAHPTEQLMQADAHAALAYLLQVKTVPPSHLVVVGEGIGASIALQLCSSSQIECPAIVLDAPDGDLLARVRHDPRSRFIPVTLLFHNTFPLDKPLRSSPSHKLLLWYGGSTPPNFFQTASDPKLTVELPTRQSSAIEQSLWRFLDQIPGE
ncbi:MAG: alpha/beta hydrolase [Acidobacteriaceae bacterium]